MSDDEVVAAGEAFNGLYNFRTRTNVKWNRLAWFVRAHGDLFSRVHRGPAFLPWHRHFLWELEAILKQVDPDVSLPYWDSTREDARDLATGKLQLFLRYHPTSGADRFDWTINRSPGSGGSLPTLTQVVRALTGKASFFELRRIEHTTIHNGPHLWVGGHMATAQSPADPLFFLHHCNIDRLWAIWQKNNPNPDPSTREHEYSARRRSGERASTAPGLEGLMAWPYNAARTPASVLDHTAMGYGYERDLRLEQAWYEANQTVLVTGDRAMAMGDVVTEAEAQARVKEAEANANVRIKAAEDRATAAEARAEAAEARAQAAEAALAEAGPSQGSTAPRPSASAATLVPRRAASTSTASAVRIDADHVYGNKRSRELHAAQCLFLRHMNPKNIVPFDSVDEALAQGFNGCRSCLPEHHTRRTE